MCACAYTQKGTHTEKCKHTQNRKKSRERREKKDIFIEIKILQPRYFDYKNAT